MKTKQRFLFALTFFLINSATQLQSQGFFENETAFKNLNLTSFSTQTINLKTYEINTDEYALNYTLEDAPKSITENDAKEAALNFAPNMVGFGVGFGFNADQTLWCISAEYYLRLAMLKNAAIYGALGAGYNGSNSDILSTSILNVTLKVLMFTQLIKEYQQVRFLYGLFGGYGFGNEKFEDGFSYDITRLTLGLVVGFQILLARQWSLMIQTNIFNYQELTRTYEDFEIKDYSRWALVNKSNLLAFSLIYTFGNSKR